METIAVITALGIHGQPATIGGSMSEVIALPTTLDISYDGGNTFPDTVEVLAEPDMNSGNSIAFSLVGTKIL